MGPFQGQRALVADSENRFVEILVNGIKNPPARRAMFFNKHK